MPPTLKTISECCAALRTSRATLFRWERTGKIKFTRLSPRKVLVAESEIDRVVEKGMR